MISKKQLRSLFLLALALGTVYQLWIFFQGYQGDITRIWKSAGQHALWRSANFTINQEAADYIAFVHEHVPPEAQIVLPASDSTPSPLYRTPLMQFYLFPREVLNCIRGDDGCLSNFSRTDAYILILDPGTFPGDLTEDNSRLLMHSNALGIYLPAVAEPGAGTALPVFQSFAAMALQAVAPVLSLLLLTSFGTLALTNILGNMQILARGAIGYGSALGLYSVLVYLLSLLGLSFGNATLIGYILAGLLCLAIYWFTRPLPSVPAPQFSIDIWHILFVALSGLLMLTAVGKGFFFGDEMVLWGPKGYGIAEAGLSAGVSNWGTSTIDYPLHNFILIGTFKQWFGELLPASKMMFPLYLLSLMFLGYEFLRQRIPKHSAGLSVLAVATAPVVIRHAETSYANLPNSFSFVAATIIGMAAFDKENNFNKKLASSILASFLFTFAMWTRPEGIALSALGLLFVLLMGWWQWDMGHRKQLALALLAPFGLFTGLWLGTSNLIYAGDLRAGATLSEMFNQMLTGDLHLYELATTISFFFTDAFYSFKDWGILGFGITLLLLAVLITQRSAFKMNLLIANGLITTAAVIGLLYITSYNVTGACDLSCYLTGGMHRFIMPAMTALWLGLCVTLLSDTSTVQNPS
ncbi:MAG: hypothetical protein DWQ07_20930 [Chloroflexi bacterium]|nr:MAG: hypothetical protein DWQ07_20930 [Chloroflexota bacterium]MBL1194550.1 hypothetical protein [Chloroflexota bacterium]NOH11838.1 hypothetical protein [Chloroflexota bacterium]